MSPREPNGPEVPVAARGRPWWVIGLGAAIVVFVLFSPSGRRAIGGFLAALRIPAPERVNVNLPSISGPDANRQLLNMVSAIVSESATTVQDEKDVPAASAAAAAQLAGLRVRLPAGRTDRPTLTVLGARTIALPVRRAQLQTMLREAGRPRTSLPAALDGSTVTLRTPRAVRAEYGHCPAPPDTTLQGQFQGRPLVTAENGDCIVLLETRAASADVPAGLDLGEVVGVALELSGLSPNEVRAFRRTLDWRAVLGLSLPRFVRSYDSVQVAGAPGVLVTTAGRRGPTYELIWARDSVAYALAGYGSSADAVPLAASLQPAGAP